jgi:hypothetical protein
VLLGGVFAVLELTNTTHLFHKEKLPVVTASETTKGVPRSTNTGTTTKEVSNDSSGVTNTPPLADKTVVTPTGEFVSNHHPNLGGSPAPNTMTSVCTTTIGVSCKITFTNTSTGTVKSLPSQTTDAGGSTYWDWKLQDIGLTAGTWKIQAVASYGSQTKTATDIMDLEVKP